MWHEARKQEKKLRCMIVDYRKRAERRREFYEKFKADPTQFMQVHGRPSKIYLEPQIAASAENCMMPWQGNADNMIDRFDVRAHLDIIPEYHGAGNASGNGTSQAVEEEQQNPGINYERYRILIQSDLSGTSEDKFLHQIHLEEQFGNSATPHSHMFGGKNLQPKVPKAAIGYNYEDSTPAFSTSQGKGSQQGGGPPPPEPDEESEEEIDFDLIVNVDDLTHGQKAELNNFGTKYGLGVGDFMEYLNGDLEEKEKLRLAKLQEEEKQAMSGRKARRERRAYKDKLIMRKGYISPPSYATYISNSPTGQENDPETTISRRSSSRSESRSRSNSPEKITFITSFGGNESDDTSGNRQRNSSGGKSLPFEPSNRHSNVASGSHPVFGPSLPAGSEKKGSDSSKRGRFISRRSRSLDFSSSSNRRRSNRSRSRSNSRRRSSRSRRSSSRGKRRGISGGGRRQRRSSSSSKSSRSRSRRRNRRRRSSSRSSRSRDRDYRRKRRRSSRSSRSKSRSPPRRSRSSRSKSRSRYRSRRSRSRNRRHSTRSSRSNSRGRNHRRRKSRRSTSSSSSSSSSPTSSPAKSSSRGSGRKRSKSSSSSPVHRVPGGKSRSKERPIIPVLQATKDSKEPENGSGAAVAIAAFTVEPTITIPPVAHQPNMPLSLLKEPTPPPPPPVRRYYGRGRKESSHNSSSEFESESGSESDHEKDGKSSGVVGFKHNGSQGHCSSRRDSDVSKGKSGMLMMMNSASKEEIMSSVGGTSSASLSISSSATNCLSNVAKLTPKERLRRKMQSALTKTFKADKEAEKQRQEKLIQERMEREESLRELTIKYRRREREKRHRDREIGGRSSSSDSSFSGSRSRSPSPQSSPNTRRKISRSRSRSPVPNY